MCKDAHTSVTKVMQITDGEDRGAIQYAHRTECGFYDALPHRQVGWCGDVS